MESTALTFRIVAFYQYMENYAAHDWDGVGECPAYWKYKGGDEVVLVDGLSMEEAFKALRDPWYRALAAKEEYSSVFAINQLEYLDMFYSADPTREEIWDAMDRGIDLEAKTYEYLTEDDFCNMPLDRYDAMSEAHGYLNA